MLESATLKFHHQVRLECEVAYLHKFPFLVLSRKLCVLTAVDTTLKCHNCHLTTKFSVHISLYTLYCTVLYCTIYHVYNTGYNAHTVITLYRPRIHNTVDHL